jgi:CheY-like chemotaxis protein
VTLFKALSRLSLILLDIQMPGVDVFMIVQKLKEDPALSGSAIVMLTPGGQRGDAARCRGFAIAADAATVWGHGQAH